MRFRLWKGAGPALAMRSSEQSEVEEAIGGSWVLGSTRLQGYMGGGQDPPGTAVVGLHPARPSASIEELHASYLLREFSGVAGRFLVCASVVMGSGEVGAKLLGANEPLLEGK